MALTEAQAAIISAGIGAAGAAANTAISATNSRRAYKWGKKMYEFQNEYNLENFSPAKQMERLKAAGLNPHLYAGGDNVSPAGSMPSTGFEVPSIDFQNVANQILNYSLQRANLDNQTKQVNSDVALKQSSTELNQSRKVAQDYTNQNILPQQYQYNARKILDMDQQISLFDTRKKLLESQAAYAAANALYAPSYFQFRNDKVKYDSLFREREYDDYMNFDLRPNDPFYARMLKPFADTLISGIISKISGSPSNNSPWYKQLLKRIFN